jgi:signal transduction histidine kinase
MLPLVVVSLRRRTVIRGRWFALFVVLGLGVGLTMAVTYGYGGTRLWRALLAGAIVFVPGLVLARPFGRSDGPVPIGSPARSLIASVDVLMASVTPGIACIGLVFEYSMSVWPILTWLVLLLLATRLTVRPLTKMLSNATRERDMIVAATEAERARIAADIHDDALQDLTMLVRRLDAAGDTTNAQAAREIAERLRAICGDLRLPVLDDLGVGPALEWLCGRLGSAETIRLDRVEGESRLPADVELAVFRVAQEALSNAIRHGAPPVRVRYRAQRGRADLEVHDAGNGIPDGTAETASRMGHLGLMNMSQRAEAIGAHLSIVSRPASGTSVGLVWEEAPTPGAGLVPQPA